ncbi:hypothetical protein [Glycomyces terrestris]|uniref:Uncharacterized protein n=1 Tax=Glycomyces terrestris TaxID=2493553 RepID=A0A426UWD8_9ACTN|nr:hypothetical protein [Glycomyces terrestris]RRR98656.1 hypothetical protein EIW28_17495 [Glycomyces terrestris]
METEVRRTLAHRSTSDLVWLTLLALPLQAALTAFGTGVMNDLYDSLKRSAARLRRPGEADPAPMVLEDPDTGLRIVLEAGLPPEALDALVSLDLDRFRSGPVHYDRARKTWRSVNDEVEG